jgi:hypothetical protein
LAVPGLSHFRLGRRVWAHVFLWGFLACLVPGLLLHGTGAGGVLLGLAFSVHSSAAADVVNRCLAECGTWGRVRRGILVSLALAVAIYWPAGWLLGRVADAHVLEAAVGPFQPGDVVLVNQWGATGPGRVVLYDLPAQRGGRLPGPRAAYVYYAGERIDRVLAGPGDRVVWDGTRLTVNGAASPWRPLAPGQTPVRVETTVPDGYVFILPSTTPLLPERQDVGTWSALCLVPRGDVHGRAYVRSHPLGRFTVLH